MYSSDSTNVSGHRFSGHSGATITLIRDQNTTFVRKQSGSFAQNDRLAAQSRKQSEWNLAGYMCPAVIGDGEFDGLYYFDMEYVIGTSLSFECINGPISDRVAIVGKIQNLLIKLRSSADDVVNPETIKNKIDSISLSIKKNVHLRRFEGTIVECLSILANRNWGGIPFSKCHGDLTLENILLRNSDVFFIDLDVPDISSYYFDIGKLFQDLFGQWCLRNLAINPPNRLTHLNAQLSLRNLYDLILPMTLDLAPDIRSILPSITALNLARTLPYCSSEDVADFIVARLKASLFWKI